MKTSSTYLHRNLAATVCGAGLLALSAAAMAAAPTNLLANPTFTDADGDKVPDKWKSSAPAEGENLRIANEADGVRILDQDKANGAGLAQYVAIEPGHKYKFTAQVKSAGGLSLYIQFMDKIPVREGDISKHRLTEATQRAAAGPDFQEFSVTATAPANATQARVWFYCPKIGLTDAVVKNASLEDLGAAPMPATGAPAVGASAAASNASAGGTATLLNPDLKDADGDKVPDQWKSSAPGGSETVKIEMDAGGGVRILDQDKENGVGLSQYVSVTPGHKYKFTAMAKGTGTLWLYLQFLDKVPVREGDIGKHRLTEKRQAMTDAAEFKEFTVEATAPANATQARVWFYCPKIGVTDAVVKNAGLQDLGAAPVSAVSPAGTGAPAANAAAGGAAVTLANPDLQDADGDNLPDGWRVYPAANEPGTKVAMAPGGGVQILDTDKNSGIGILQQLPAQAGVSYTLSAVVKGASSISLNFQFLSDNPVREGDIGKVTVGNKQVYAAGTPDGKEATLTATAPVGTKFMRVWLYCPKIGVTDVVVQKVRLSSAAPMASAAPLNEKLLFVGDFESNSFDNWNTQFPPSTKGQIVTTPVRAGKYALRNELTYADFKANSTESRNRRSEIYYENVGRPGQERWYGFSVYLPKDWEDEMFDIVMQIHNKPDPGEGPKSPILSLVTQGKNWVVSDRYDKEKISKPAKNGSGGTITTNTVWTGPFETEKWTDWVLHVKWSLEDDGLIEVWRDGQKVGEYKGPNGYNDDEPYYMKIGVYKPAYRNTSPPQRVIFHDEVRIGNEKATYADVAPPAK